MNRQEPPVTITNPTGYPPTETFREGIVASAANLARYWAGRGDEECERLLEDIVSKMEVVIAVVPTEGDTFTFYTVKGALTLAMAETGDARMFSMMGIPCADAEQA